MIFGYLTNLILLGVVGLLTNFAVQWNRGDHSVFTHGGWGACLVAVGVIVWKVWLILNTRNHMSPEDNLLIQSRKWFRDRGGEYGYITFVAILMITGMLPVALANPTLKDPSVYYLLATAFLPVLAIITDAIFATVVLEEQYQAQRLYHWHPR